MLFLRIRMSHAIDLINQKCFPAAYQYFEEHIHSLFQKVIEEGGKGHKNASIADLKEGLAQIADSLADKSTPHLYTGSLIKLMVNDYMRLYLPNNIGYKVRGKKDPFWVFAFPLDYGLTRPSYPCLACSQKVFHTASIRDLPLHLESCPSMNTPYVEDLFAHCRILKEAIAAQPDQKLAGVEKAGRKRGRNDLTTQAGTSTVVDEKDILAEISREIEGAEDLHARMGGEVQKVIKMHKSMGEAVDNIVGMHTGMGQIVNKVKCLACSGLCPVAATDLSGTDLGATNVVKADDTTIMSANLVTANKDEVEEAELHSAVLLFLIRMDLWWLIIIRLGVPFIRIVIPAIPRMD
ncbi:uncharacterized protein LOC112269474 [Brachypodium distachyon]|nr:uncharacterized protein LOC112269474 [Brachypodium distachyon]|eukprot:XP_024312014.1 uncharacterized protein LOC112269474 [Brachypodium distachyon]